MASAICLVFATFSGVCLLGSACLLMYFPMLGMILTYLTARLTWQFTSMFFRAASLELISR